MAKKAEKVTEEKTPLCPECGGPRWGRGYAHEAGCRTVLDKAPRRAKQAREDGLVVDGRTRISTLLKLQARVGQLLGEKDAKEVKRVKEALAKVDKLRAELQEAEELIN